MPACFAVVNGIVAIGEGAQIALYKPQQLQGRIELERICLTQVHVLVSSLVSFGEILVAADALRSIQTYKVSAEGMEEIQVDSFSKNIRNMCIFNDVVFAGTYNSSLYAFLLKEDGTFDEIGCI